MRRLFLTFLITSSFVVYAKSAESTQSANQQNVQAGGVIVEFHVWPNTEDETVFLKKLQELNLTEKAKLDRYKKWIFQWSQVSHKSQALKVCSDLLKLNISSMKNCEPDTATDVDEIVIDDLTSTGDLRSCNVVSSGFGLLENKLSDYWAKELIGADLLREDLEDTPAPDKENFISMFDLPKNEHDARVKHVISDDGKSGVLPETDVEVFHTPFASDGLIQANKLLDRVDQECSDQRDVASQDTTTGGDTTGGTTTSTTTTGGDTTGSTTSTTTTGGDTTGSTTQGDTTGSTGGPDANSTTTTTTTTTTGGDTTGSTTGGDTADHIEIRKWANEKDIPIDKVFGFLDRESIPISEIDSPYKAGLVEAGESYSPTVRVVASEYSDELEAFAATVSPPNYSRTLSNVVWKNATDWSTEWKSASGDQTPDTGSYDLTADYEVDMDQTHWLYGRSYSYIFRPPVLDMRGGSSISTDLFNWLPRMVLVNSSKKIKIWGKWRVGKSDGTATGTNAPLVINGVSVQMTLVSGTISTIPGSAKNHGQWEATLSASDFTTILGTVSSNEDVSNRRTSSEPDQPSVGTR
ncbi:MAG: hypothetical protein OXK80_04350 [Bdellovibrionales bacterium]|nr:hypothetical protein [Bdellovibrionales bacterium]